MGLAFTHDAHAGVADGSITVTYRAWERPQVRAGGRYRVGASTVQVTSLKRVPLATVPAEHRARLGSDVKADVRKLKALGLTESLEVGYRLSPLGSKLLDP